MKKIIVLLFLNIISFISLAQSNNDLVINRLMYKVSLQNRNKIKHFILRNGQSKFYNQLYGNCPYYRFNNVDVYLLPVNTVITKDDDESSTEYNDKYALYLKYNNDNQIEQNDDSNTTIKDLRSDINYIVKVANEK